MTALSSLISSGTSGPLVACLRYAVFALGDTGYENFCQCGRDLDGFFEKHGAERLLQRIDNDIDFEEALKNWQREVLGGGILSRIRANKWRLQELIGAD